MTTKKLIYTLCIVALFAIGLTAGLIFYNYQFNAEYGYNNTNGKSNDKNTGLKEIDYTFGVKSLDSKYTVNNIEIEEIRYTEGTPFKEYDWQDKAERYPLLITYYKISGLKDKEVENKINEKIKNFAFNMLPSGEASFKEVSLTVTANLSNVISINGGSTMKQKLIKGDPRYVEDSEYNFAYEYGNMGLNIDLKTGEDIKLEDVFVENYNFKQQLSNHIYNELAWDYEYDWDYDAEHTIDRGDLEDRQFATLYEFEKGNYTFHFSPTSLNIYIKNANDRYRSEYQYCGLLFYEYYDKIAIFNRFLTTESLFEAGESSEKRYCFIEDYVLENIHENKENLFMYFDESGNNVYSDEYKTLYQEWINGRENANKNYASANPNKQIIEIIHPEYGYEGEPVNLDISYINVDRIELPKDVYQNEVKELLMKLMINLYRDYFGEGLQTTIDKFIEEVKQYDNTYVVQGKNGIYHSYGNEYNDYKEIIDHDTFFVLPSDEKLLTEEDIQSLDIDKLRIAYNEIFARYGHDFANANLRSYFLGQVWYAMIPGKAVSIDELSDIERANADLINKRIESLKNSATNIVTE